MNKFDFKFDSFKCEICGGKCCIGESGFIWLTPDEIKNLADFLGINTQKFKEIYTQKIGVRISLKEKEYNDELACIFFDEIKKNCSVYEARPNQCKSFPFWDYFKDNYEELEKECIGVMRC